MRHSKLLFGTNSKYHKMNVKCAENRCNSSFKSNGFSLLFDLQAAEYKISFFWFIRYFGVSLQSAQSNRMIAISYWQSIRFHMENVDIVRNEIQIESIQKNEHQFIENIRIFCFSSFFFIFIQYDVNWTVYRVQCTFFYKSVWQNHKIYFFNSLLFPISYINHNFQFPIYRFSVSCMTHICRNMYSNAWCLCHIYKNGRYKKHFHFLYLHSIGPYWCYFCVFPFQVTRLKTRPYSSSS